MSDFSQHSIQFNSVTQSCPTLRPPESQHARPPSPSLTPGVHSNSRPSSHWCHPAISSSVVPFSSCPQSLPASVFSNESTLHIRWPKYWSFSFSIILPKEHPGLVSFRMNWLDLFAVQRTLKSLLQHHSSKASILLRSAFFTVQLLHPYITTGKTTALTSRTFVGKVMSLLLNMLFTQHNGLQFHPCGYKWQSFFFYDWVIYCTTSLSIHLSIDSFHVLTTLNKNMCIFK